MGRFEDPKLNVVAVYACCTCDEALPEDEFYRNAKLDRGFAHECKTCTRARSSRNYHARKSADPAREVERRREWRTKNPDQEKRHALAWRAKQYGLTIEDYELLHDKQGGLCAICSEADPVSGRSLSIDHCHETGEVRGLLCFSCNTALGKFREDVEIVRRALRYLERRNGKV